MSLLRLLLFKIDNMSMFTGHCLSFDVCYPFNLQMYCEILENKEYICACVRACVRACACVFQDGCHTIFPFVSYLFF